MLKNMSETSLINTTHHRRMKKCHSTKKTNGCLMKYPPFHQAKDLFLFSFCVFVLKMPLQMPSLSLKDDWTLTDGRPLTLFVFTKGLPAETSQGHASQHLLFHLGLSFKSWTALSTSLIIASCLDRLCFASWWTKTERTSVWDNTHSSCGWAETGRFFLQGVGERKEEAEPQRQSRHRRTAGSLHSVRLFRLYMTKKKKVGPTFNSSGPLERWQRKGRRKRGRRDCRWEHRGAIGEQKRGRSCHFFPSCDCLQRRWSVMMLLTRCLFVTWELSWNFFVAGKNVSRWEE